MRRRRAIVYLHGFASSPSSSKARYFAARAAEAGVPFACPDLNRPEFSTLTVTRMIGQVDEALEGLPEGPTALVGSSLGAFVALHAAAARRAVSHPSRPIDRLVLLAPALNLAEGLAAEFGPARMAAWERTGTLDVFHYAENAERPLRWDFMADVRRYDAADLHDETPTLIYQGRHDTVVDPVAVERFAASRPWVTLRLVDDDHQLLKHLDAMWADVARFLEIEE